MESIFHEKQEGLLCAQHCLNSLLQGAYFTAVDLAQIANELDEAERQHMMEGDDYNTFVQAPSENMDDSGYFSIQVLCRALIVWNLEMVPYNSSDASAARRNPVGEKAYILNQQNHWLTIRKIHNQWFNLNSLKAWPELITDTYLSLLLAQLQNDGYSVFVVRGLLPVSEADHRLSQCGGITKQDFERFDAAKHAEIKNKSDAKKATSKTESVIEKPESVKNSTAVTADAETVRNKRLQFFEKKNNENKSVGSGNKPVESDEEDMLRKAIAMSQESFHEQREEDMLQAALELSMKPKT